jgi:hypothetical protein
VDYILACQTFFQKKTALFPRAKPARAYQKSGFEALDQSKKAIVRLLRQLLKPERLFFQPQF